MGRLSRALCIATVGLLIAGAYAASAGAAIYWETNAGIGRANLDGTNPQRLFIPVPHLGVSNRVCGSVAVDHTHLYWTNTESNAVERASLDSGDVDFDFIPTATETCGVAVDQSHVYWVNSGDVTVGRANLDGTDPVQDFIEGPSRPCDVEVNAEHVFWGNVNMDWLSRADLDGESITPDFIEEAGGGCGIAVTGDRIYWSDLGNSIGRANLDGNEVEREFITGLDRPCGIAIQDGFIFWAEQNLGERGQIGRARLDGSGVNRGLVPEVSDPCGIAADDRLVPPPPPPPPPPRFVSFGRVKHGKAQAATFVSLLVPQAGSIKPLVGLPRIGWGLSGSRDIASDGKRWLKLVPKGPRAARRRFLRLLDREGRIIVPLRIEYTTEGHTTFTPRKTVLLLRPSQRR